MKFHLLGVAALAVSLAACETAPAPVVVASPPPPAAPPVAAAPPHAMHHAAAKPGRAKTDKHMKTAASHAAGDGAYMGGGMVVTTPVGTGIGTGTNTAVGGTVTVPPGTPMTVPSGVAVPAK